MKINPLFLIDFYKASHRQQYPENTTLVYSNFTPRSDKYSNVQENGVIVFGIQAFIIGYLIDLWQTEFFLRPKNEVVEEYKLALNKALNSNSDDYKHIEDLHDLGYLPLEIKALEEGTMCPIGVPCLTIKNTDPKFFWLVNYLEGLLSNELWRPMTSATTALHYRREFERHAALTGSPKDFIDWQGHDFSFRGMGGVSDAGASGAGHLLSFLGTDTFFAIPYVEQYYPTNSFIGGSVPATEHSVMSMGTCEDELGTFRRLITQIYPSGIISIVSDTWDLWKVLTEYLPILREEVLARDGRVVIRPDSGDPVDIICGNLNSLEQSLRNKEKCLPENIGAYELLWDIFGGTINEKGYKVLNPKIGLIYGDSITPERQKEILARLEAKGFTASNLVLGIGSYTYEYVTRDTHGFAMKATYGEVNGVGREIFKNPVTDEGLKKSAKGLLQVKNKVLKDQCTWEEEQDSDLKTVFLNGNLTKFYTFDEVRNNLKKYL